MMKKIIIFSAIYLAPIIISFAGDYKRSVITDPSITRRCNSLRDKRIEKINLKQRYQSLLARNRKLQGITPDNKKSVKKKLINTERHIQNELELATLKISRLEEGIVRQGCPGISL
ncbi:hypothetical protein HBN50_11345 [Halobacteriovorax sp. GB3]|uniref:hypothetical protein n=1 Tax=Halobacteriovorax sp. GB3 TaxID=2719615 RepID=UPI002361BE85|nr:hypothetical protein [Halobacteriovorax sp. GB3]MDD0853695.1 hypothetical protein [Halobacteriovorax sp. GB3]